jgi:hypothetical protein
VDVWQCTNVHYIGKYTGFRYPLQRQGVLVGLRPEQQGFLCVKSQASDRLIYH